MSTNFYLVNKSGRLAHFGKRSGAGRWCFTCNISLIEGMADNPHFIHNGAGKAFSYEICPRCSTPAKSACSWIWAIDPKTAMTLIHERVIQDPYGWIQDEYGRMVAPEAFSAMIQECRIIFYDSIGTQFS